MPLRARERELLPLLDGPVRTVSPPISSSKSAHGWKFLPESLTLPNTETTAVLLAAAETITPNFESGRVLGDAHSYHELAVQGHYFKTPVSCRTIETKNSTPTIPKSTPLVFAPDL